jgi:hypothetical protein
MFILLVPIYSFVGYWFGGYLWLFEVKLPYVINSYWWTYQGEIIKVQ